MNKQVLSVEQMQHLKELGVDTSKASCYWWYAEGKNYLYWGKCSDVKISKKDSFEYGIVVGCISVFFGWLILPIACVYYVYKILKNRFL